MVSFFLIQTEEFEVYIPFAKKVLDANFRATINSLLARPEITEYLNDGVGINLIISYFLWQACHCMNSLKLYQLCPLWEWTRCHCIFSVRQGWNAGAVFQCREMQARVKRVAIDAGVYVETCYDITSILKICVIKFRWSGMQCLCQAVCGLQLNCSLPCIMHTHHVLLVFCSIFKIPTRFHRDQEIVWRV